MSYPSQPQYTPPYGQPPQKQGNNNLWMIGGTVIAVLAILMTVILVLVQQGSDSDEAGDPSQTEGTDGSQSEGTEEETSAEVEEASGFNDDVCQTYDMTSFEEVFGEAPDPNESYTSASSSGETGSLTCSFYTSDYDFASIYVDVTNDAEFNIGWVEDNKQSYSDDSDYEVTDYTELGDAGYMRVYASGSTETIAINVAVQNIEIEAEATIYLEDQDHDEAVAMVEDLLMQGYLKFAGYEQ